MIFSFFDPPQTKAQKRGAKQAQSLREQSVRDAVIELRMLIRDQYAAREVQGKLFDLGHQEFALKVMAAADTAQETIDRVARFDEAFPRELADLGSRLADAASYEALTSFELEGRDFMIRIKDEAKAQLGTLGAMVIQARQFIGELPTRH